MSDYKQNIIESCDIEANELFNYYSNPDYKEFTRQMMKSLNINPTDFVWQMILKSCKGDLIGYTSYRIRFSCVYFGMFMQFIFTINVRFLLLKSHKIELNCVINNDAFETISNKCYSNRIIFQSPTLRKHVLNGNFDFPENTTQIIINEVLEPIKDKILKIIKTKWNKIYQK